MNHGKILFAVICAFVVISTTNAQQSERSYTIGYVSFFPDAFKAAMSELGYIEGVNVTYMLPVFDETIAPEEMFDHYNRQVQAMADAGVDIFVTNTDTDAVYLSGVAGDTPIVFARSDDPVATGAVADLINPGGHMTGTVTNRPHERRLQLLTEIDPTTDSIYYLYSTFTGEAETVLQQVQAVAAELNVEVVPAPITDLESALTLLENTPDDVDWLFLTPFVPYDLEFFQALSTVSMSNQIGISWVTDDAMPGYLMGYGPNIAVTEQQAAQIVDRILRGASPADLPVQIAENYLMVNLEAASAINLEIPEGILRQASTIVRPGYFDNFTFGG